MSRSYFYHCAAFTKILFQDHPDKPQFITTQKLEPLEFMISSKLMIVRLTLKKLQKGIDVANKCLSEKSLTARDLAKLLGMCKASLSVIEFGRLYLWYIQRKRNQKWQYGKINYGFQCELSQNSRKEIPWWIFWVDFYFFGAAYNDSCSWGHWTSRDASLHINVLEMKAALFCTPART